MPQQTAPLLLTPRRREILTVLTQKVRYLSTEQLGEHWWSPGPTGQRAARREVAGLVAAGYVERYQLLARPLASLEDGPVFEWAPGDPAPDYNAVSYGLQARWKASLRAVTVVLATPHAAAELGGVASGLRLPEQASHDLAVAAIYLQLRRTEPEAACAWVSEDYFRLLHRGRRATAGRVWPALDKEPDAVLLDDRGQIVRLVEFGGSYDARRVEKTHRSAVRAGLPYSLW
jgi:hypothetical protein